MKRAICILLGAILILTTSACSTQKGAAQSGGSNTNILSEDGEKSFLPLANGTVELVLYTGMENNARQVYQSYAEHPVVKKMIEETGLKLSFMHPPQGDDGTFFNTTIASGKYPDLFQNDFAAYPGGPDGAIEDGVIIKMNDLIEQYAPTYLKMVEERGERVAKKTKSDIGNIIRFGTTFTAPILEGKANRGLIARRDWLEQLGMEPPQTIEEYEAFLKAMKNELGVEAPLAMCQANHWLWTTGHYFSAAYGVTQSGFYMDGDNVHYAPIQDGYRQYLELFKRWYQEGYIDQDFPNRLADDSQKMFVNGRAGILMTGNWMLQQILTLGRIEDPSFDIVALNQPVVKKGDRIDKVLTEESVDGKAWFVSATSKHPVEAVKFIEYLHLPETMTLTAWGPGTEEYPTYEVVGGKKTFTDFMSSNPEMDFQAARERYTLNYFQVMWDQEMEEQQYSHPANLEAWEKWSENADKSGLIPDSITLTADESRDLARIMNQINTYADEMFYKFVMGLEPLDKFDAYVQQIKGLGIDQAIAIRQGAHERYLKR